MAFCDGLYLTAWGAGLLEVLGVALAAAEGAGPAWPRSGALCVAAPSDAVLSPSLVTQGFCHFGGGFLHPAARARRARCLLGACIPREEPGETWLRIHSCGSPGAGGLEEQASPGMGLLSSCLKLWASLE